MQKIPHLSLNSFHSLNRWLEVVPVFEKIKSSECIYVLSFMQDQLNFTCRTDSGEKRYVEILHFGASSFEKNHIKLIKLVKVLKAKKCT